MKAFVIDLNKCNGCYGCQIACKDENVENDWMPYAKPQPNTGQFWLRMSEKVHGQVPKVRVEYRPMLCRHCDNAPCIVAAPEAVYRREDGLVIIDPVKAKDNKALVDSCPYGAIYWNEELSIAQKCTGCAHRVDKGEVPHCVEACPTGALLFGEEEEFADRIADSSPVFDAEGTGPRVHYLNPFGLFISGEVWDPAADSIIEGAKIILTDTAGVACETETDGFGDFWFWHLREGAYRLEISAAGFKGVERAVDLSESINIGDFPLEKD
jgi:tetrathionate reductase subunit B